MDAPSIKEDILLFVVIFLRYYYESLFKTCLLQTFLKLYLQLLRFQLYIKYKNGYHCICCIFAQLLMHNRNTLFIKIICWLIFSESAIMSYFKLFVLSESSFIYLKCVKEAEV